MKSDGEGKGKVVPTGKRAPVLEVNYNIGHCVLETKGPDGRMVQRKRTVVHSIVCDEQPIPLGDCDLLVGDELLRLRHNAGHPEWLVLSSDA